MKKLSAILLALCFGTSLQAATGASESEAKSISVSTTQYDSNLTLVKESGDDGWWSGGVYYLKATLQKGASYTVWFDGYDSAELSLDAYAGGDGFDGPWASFGWVQQQGTHYVSWLQASDWDDDDPSSWTYFFKLEGEVGQRTQFHIVQGIRSFLEEGDEDNPKVLNFTTSQQKGTYAITSAGSFYFQANLTADRKYLIRTTTGTAEVKNYLTVSSAYGYTVEDDPDYASDTANTALAVYPKKTGTYVFCVYGPAVGANFGIAYKSIPARTIANHPYTQIAENETKTFKPGRVVADAAYYDEIIDEHLFRFTATKGDCWIIDAKGADRPVEMRLYNSNGVVLETNATVGDGTHDVRIGYEITASGNYYVGVCDPSLVMTSTVVCADTQITAYCVEVGEDVPEAISPVPGEVEGNPFKKGAVSGPYTLDATRWTRTLTIAGRKDVTYRVGAILGEDYSPLSLKATVFRYSGTSEIVVSGMEDVELVPDVSVLSFTATANATYGIRISVAEGEGLPYPPFKVGALGTTEDENLGMLTVRTRGAESATWTLNTETVKYQSGDSVLLPTNKTYTVKFAKVTGFSAPADAKNVEIAGGTVGTVVVGTYSDTYDPKDDVYTGATKLTVSAKETLAARTLWGDDGTGNVADEADWFTVTAKDGYYYDFGLRDLKGDAVMSVYAQVKSKPAAKPLADANSVTNLSKYVLGAGTFYICVTHGSKENQDSSYALAAKSANVGSIKFSKTSYSAKKNAGSVKVTVNRTAKEGRVRVMYATVAGTARPGVRYVAQSGVLEWADGDSKAKDITVKLIPDLVAVYEGDTEFQMILEAFPEDELKSDEYPAQITVDTCTVKVTESATKTTTSIEKAYAKTLPTVATVKTEDTALRAGTFFGVLAEDGSALTNGFPQLASVTLTTTLKTGKPDTLSAKVALAGKTYTFKSDTKNPEEWEDIGDGYKQIALTLVNKNPNATNELVITVMDGETTEEDAWLKSGGTVELTMTVPDATGKGGQEGIVYRGEIFRQNAKINDYLALVAETFFGYYTVALVPQGVSTADGIPAGNGYLTVKVDNKGTATVAGVLADGTTVSTKVTAAMIKEDADSANGYAMYLPVYLGKSPYCFGGVIKLTAKAGTTLPGDDFVRVVDSTQSLVWNNDNPALTYFKEDGWRISCSPVGGWYDTVMNLEAYYLNYALSVGTADVSEFPTELLKDGYDFVADVQPNGEAASFANDVLSTAKKSLVKAGKLYDLVNSVNPCNVQVKLARATGIVTGSFSLWSANEDGTQKEITGATHKGVLLLERDDFAGLGDDVVSAGFCSAKVTLKELNAKGKTVTRSWTYSLPFNLLGVELDAGDPWAEDKGWNPDWGEKPTEPEI